MCAGTSPQKTPFDNEYAARNDDYARNISEDEQKSILCSTEIRALSNDTLEYAKTGQDLHVAWETASIESLTTGT